MVFGNRVCPPDPLPPLRWRQPSPPCLGLPQALGPPHVPAAGCRGHGAPGEETEGSPAGWQGQRQNHDSAGQGWLSREGSQLGGGRVGIWTKPHCPLSIMPLAYFAVGRHRGAPAAPTWLRRGTRPCCPHVPSAGFRRLPGPLLCSLAYPKPVMATAAPLAPAPTVNGTGLGCLPWNPPHSPFSCFRRAFRGLLDRR